MEVAPPQRYPAVSQARLSAVPSPMKPKTLNILAILFFVAAQVLLVVALSGPKTSSTLPLCLVALGCLAVSVVTGIVGLRRASKAKNQPR